MTSPFLCKISLQARGACHCYRLITLPLKIFIAFSNAAQPYSGVHCNLQLLCGEDVRGAFAVRRNFLRHSHQVWRSARFYFAACVASMSHFKTGVLRGIGQNSSRVP